MLNDRERRILADLERELADREPRTGDPSGRHARILGPRWWPLVILGIAVAVFLVTLGLIGNAVLLLAVAPHRSRRACSVACVARPRRIGGDRCDPGRHGCQPTER